MSKLYSSFDIRKVIEILKFFYVSQKGSHGKFKNAEGNIVILPMNKKEIPEGTFRNILKQASISFNQFKNIWKTNYD